MQPAAQVDRHPLRLHGEAGGEERAAGHRALRLQHPFGLLVGDLLTEDGQVGLRPAEGVQVVVRVHPAQVAEGGGEGVVHGAGRQEAGRFEEGQDALAAQRVVGGAGQVGLVAPAVDELGRGPAQQAGQLPPPAPESAQEGMARAHRGVTAAPARWRPSRRLPPARRRSRPPGDRARGACAPSAAARRCRGHG